MAVDYWLYGIEKQVLEVLYSVRVRIRPPPPITAPPSIELVSSNHFSMR